MVWPYKIIANITSLIIGLFTVLLTAISSLNRKQDKKDIENLKKSVDKLDEVSKMDDISVCIELGGLRDECNKLRGNTKLTKDN